MIKLKDLLNEDVGQLKFPKLLSHNKHPESHVKRLHDPSGKKIRHPRTGRNISNISKAVASKMVKARGHSPDDVKKKSIGGISYSGDDVHSPIAISKRNDYVIQHEAFHNTMNLIYDTHGEKVYKKIMDEMMQLYPSKLVKILSHLLQVQRSYKRKQTGYKDSVYVFNEEIITITRDILAGGTGSSAFNDFIEALDDYDAFNVGNPEKVVRYYISQLKSVWKDLLYYSKNVTLEELS